MYTDGGSHGNPGPAGAGGVILEAESLRQLCTVSLWIGKMTNNQAEYYALIETLQRVNKFEVDQIDCFLDSQLIVRQLNGQYKVKNEKLRPLYDQVEALIAGSQIRFNHVHREENNKADALANQAMDSREDKVIYHEIVKTNSR